MVLTCFFFYFLVFIWGYYIVKCFYLEKKRLLFDRSNDGVLYLWWWAAWVPQCLGVSWGACVRVCLLLLDCLCADSFGACLHARLYLSLVRIYFHLNAWCPLLEKKKYIYMYTFTVPSARETIAYIQQQPATPKPRPKVATNPSWMVRSYAPNVFHDQLSVHELLSIPQYCSLHPGSHATLSSVVYLCLFAWMLGEPRLHATVSFVAGLQLCLRACVAMFVHTRIRVDHQMSISAFLCFWSRTRWFHCCSATLCFFFPFVVCRVFCDHWQVFIGWRVTVLVGNYGLMGKGIGGQVFRLIWKVRE